MADKDRSTHVDILELTKYDDNPFTPASDERFLATVGANLKFWTGTSWSTLGTGGGSSATWEELFAVDATFNIVPDNTFTIAGGRSTATDVVTLTNVAGGSGDVIKIENSGTGADISGTSDTWTITKAGAATFVGVTPGGDITSTSTAIDWDLADNNASALSFDTAGVAGMLEFVTTNSSEVLKTAAPTFQVTQGLTDLIQASNTVSALRVTDNTATTFGADAASAGVAVFRSTSLTTGSLVQLQLTEGTLNGGFYLTARDATAGANVFTVGEDGALTIAGLAGSTVSTITAGDAIMSDGSLAITDADNAVSLSVTNNTATTSDVVMFTGSGVFTGTGASAFVAVTQSGATTGDVMSVTANGLTTGTALQLTSTGTIVTTGDMLSVTANSATTSTGLVRVSGTGLTSGFAALFTGGGANVTSSGGVVDITGGAATDGAMLRVATTGVYTGTAGVVDINASSATTGNIVSIDGTGLTTGTALLINTTTATLTSGFYIECNDGAASDFTVGDNGATIIAGSAAGTDALTLTAGDATITSGDLTLSAGTVSITETADGAALTIVSDATTTGNVIDVNADGVTSGVLLHLDSSSAGFTGKYIECYDGAAADFSVGANGATTIAGSAALTAALTLTAGDLVISDGLTQHSVNAGVTADVGSVQGGEPITNFYTEIATVGTGGDAVTLPTAAAGRMVIITNHGANAADVFPASGDAINEGAADAATSIAVNETLLAIAYDATNWEVVQLARNS